MIATVATVVIATLTFLGIIGGVANWLYRRGGNERDLSESITRNTAATTELAAQVGGLRTTLEAHGNTLTEHHWRLKALEDTSVKVTVERTVP
jgi:hypothetical protein